MDKITAANNEWFDRVMRGSAKLVDVRIARDSVPGMRNKLVLHAGPPVTWERMCGTMRGAVIGASMYEGWAKTPEEAEALAKSGDLTFAPTHDHDCVGPMAGIITESMPVYVIRNDVFDYESYTTLNMGLGKVLRFGAYDNDVMTRLRWMNDEMAPVMKAAINHAGGLDLIEIMSNALHMGDELHNRNKSATSLMLRLLAPHVGAVCKPEMMEKALAYLGSSDSLFLNHAMAASKAILEPAADIEYCSIVSTMCRNGTDFGVRISGTGKQWFVTDSPKVQGLYFPGYSEVDANPDIGDSCITEVVGVGAFAMAGALAITQLIGGTVNTAMETTQKMYEITHSDNERFSIPQLNFRGSPTGIDLMKVIETGIEPEIDTGIAHKEPGIGQIGAGLTVAPFACFEQAIEAYAQKYAL